MSLSHSTSFLTFLVSLYLIDRVHVVPVQSQILHNHERKRRLEYDMKATFFVLGVRYKINPDFPLYALYAFSVAMAALSPPFEFEYRRPDTEIGHTALATY